MNPKITIIVPCYMQAQYLDEALQSVYDQTFQEWECIIVNDGSLDDTEEVALKWVNKDSRFIYLIKKNGGLSSARNFGISHSSGEFILPLDADDYISTSYVADALLSFEQDASLKLVYCKAEKFGSQNGLWKLPVFSLSNLSRNNMIFCSAVFKKADWKLVGGYDEEMKYGWEDWEFWIALLKNGGNVKQLETIGFYYRVKEVSMVKQMDEQKKESLLQYMSIKHSDFYVKQLGSYKKINDDLENTKDEFKRKLASKKFVCDLFFKTFFGCTLFGKYKQQ